MIKSLGERDFSAQETMHLLMSLNLYFTTFKVLPINLNGSRKVETNVDNDQLCTKDSLLDACAKRENYKDVFPEVASMNFNLCCQL